MSIPNAPPPPPPQVKRYAVWNNKGGVGKTFVTFVVAAEYARLHPDEVVVVVDMCPQANISEIVLGGNGDGAAHLNRFLTAPPQRPRASIGGYFDQRIRFPHNKTGTELSFLIDAPTLNKNLPANMRLVAGDPSLELQTQAMNQIAGQSLPPNAWGSVHRWLADMLDAITTQIPSAVFFIDCNPSFSAYTGVALLAANRVIVPCTADGSSARAIDNVGRLLYGIGLQPAYAAINFAEQASKYGLALPSIHIVPLNRSTQYDKKASKAFGAMYDEIQNRVSRLRQAMPAYFSLPADKDPFMDIPDAHSVAVVASHYGRPLARITAGAHDIYGVTCQVNPEPLERYTTAVTRLMGLL
jgi:cellulose biosynthesis protein BcsQ